MRLIRKAFLYLSLGVMFIAHISRYLYLRIFHAKKSINGVRAILLIRDRVVLVRHWFAPGVWTLPGGGVRTDETAGEAGKREVAEETGLIVRSWGGQLGTYQGKMGSRDSVTVLFTDDIAGGLRLLPSVEIMERGLFDLDRLPSTLSPANRRRIEAYKMGVREERGTW